MDFTVPGTSGGLHGSSLTCDSLSAGEDGAEMTFPQSWTPLVPMDVARDGAFVTWRDLGL